MADVTERMLALLSTLQTGRRFSSEELASRLEVSQRTVRRDIDRLRSYGYPVDTRPGPGGYYRLTAGRSLPPLALDDDEAMATLLGLALLATPGSMGSEALDDAATRAYGKIDQLLPARLRPQLTALRASLETGSPPSPAVATSLVAGLAGAIAHQQVVRFDYLDRRGATSRRRVEPHRQVHLQLRWYLLGWDLDRHDWRVFRMDRITGLTPTAAPFQPRSLPASTAVDYLREGLHADRQEVRLTVRAPAHEVADALKYQDADIRASDGDTTQVTVWLDSWEWLILNLAFLGAEFTIIGPRSVQEACGVFARRLLAATAAS